MQGNRLIRNLVILIVVGGGAALYFFNSSPQDNKASAVSYKEIETLEELKDTPNISPEKKEDIEKDIQVAKEELLTTKSIYRDMILTDISEIVASDASIASTAQAVQEMLEQAESIDDKILRHVTYLKIAGFAIENSDYNSAYQILTVKCTFNTPLRQLLLGNCYVHFQEYTKASEAWKLGLESINNLNIDTEATGKIKQILENQLQTLKQAQESGNSSLVIVPADVITAEASEI